MKLFLRLGLTLLGFCAVATALLAYVNSITKPLIDEHQRTAAEQTMSKLIPEAVFEPVTIHTEKDSLVYYIAKDQKTGEIKGYTFTAVKPGYSSMVKTMAAIDTNFKIINIQVIEQSETPGLGANCTKPEFSAKFTGLSADDLVVDRDGGKFVSLTGATITTRAVTNSLRDAIKLIQKDVESKTTTPSGEAQK